MGFTPPPGRRCGCIPHRRTVAYGQQALCFIQAGVGTSAADNKPTINYVPTGWIDSVTCQPVLLRTECSPTGEITQSYGFWDAAQVFQEPTSLVPAKNLAVSLATTSVRCVSLVDDVAGDGSGLLNPFVELCLTSVDVNNTITNTSLGYFTDDKGTTPYAVLGTIRKPDELGVPAHTDQVRFSVSNGATWSPTADLHSYTILVVTGSPTYCDSDSTITTLVPGENLEYFAAINGVFDTAPVLKTDTGDEVIVTATRMGA